MPLLGINIDHVATVRQARRSTFPDIVEAAKAAVAGGADGITVHLREDRRHIQDRDVANIRKQVPTRLNLEMAGSEGMIRIARVVVPDNVCLVPEKRQELTTEGGLDVQGQLAKIRTACQKMKTKGIIVSLFIDPDPAQVQAAKAAGADAVEIHTGAYANAPDSLSQQAELKKIQDVSREVLRLGMRLNAGHGLDYDNVKPVAQIPGMYELNIGFAVIARALFVGLEQAVREMKTLVSVPVPAEKS